MSKSNLKEILFIKFDILDSFTTQTLTSSFEFIAQSPEDESVLERAIMIKFKTEDSEEFHLNITCRVVYCFDSADSMPAEEKFAEQYYLDAYSVFCKKTNEIMSCMGKPTVPFPELE